MYYKLRRVIYVNYPCYIWMLWPDLNGPFHIWSFQRFTKNCFRWRIEKKNKKKDLFIVIVLLLLYTYNAVWPFNKKNSLWTDKAEDVKPLALPSQIRGGLVLRPQRYRLHRVNLSLSSPLPLRERSNVRFFRQ